MAEGSRLPLDKSMTTQSMKLKFRKALELAVLAAVFYFIARVILNNLDQLRDTTLRLDPWYATPVSHSLPGGDPNLQGRGFGNRVLP